jgi:amidase
VDLVEVRQALEKREISPVELIEQITRKIERENPRINAFVAVYPEEARLEARDCERRILAGTARRMEGIPVTIKDSIDVSGTPTSCGSLLNRDASPARDATSVRLLRDAGAIIVGKTNCPEFLMNYETDNRIIGRTNNPWDVNRTPGGSSGGEAAAIGVSFSAGGLGSDGGGSIRFPAHCCGIAGLKPTSGRVSAAGHVPEIAHPGGLLGAVGPMARTAEDTRALFEVLAQYDPRDPFSTPLGLRTPDIAPFLQHNLKIGIMRGWLDVPVESVMRQVVEKAGYTLCELGFEVENFRPHGVERATEVWWFFFGRIHSRMTEQNLERNRDQLHWTGTELLDLALEAPEPAVAAILENFALRDRMRTALLEQMETYRVLLLPVSGVVAFPHRQRQWCTANGEIGLLEAMAPLTPFNLFGMPAMVIPFGFSDDGIPCGVQLVGRPYEEELLLELAVRLEHARGRFPSPPGFETIL